MGKEQDLLQYYKDLPQERKDAIKGHPHKVLEVIDEFSANVDWLMNIGQKKGKVIIDRIKQQPKQPELMIELGGYMGYSAILFSQHLVRDHHHRSSKYYSFELNPEFAEIARYFIEVAGLSSVVEVVVGKASETLPAFAQTIASSNYVAPDFVFIDHWKDQYVPDLRVLETLNLIAPGTLIVADNILHPGAPEYVKYVQSSPQERKQFNHDVPNVNGSKWTGRWNILYDSETVDIHDPRRNDQVEFTVCREYLNG